MVTAWPASILLRKWSRVCYHVHKIRLCFIKFQELELGECESGQCHSLRQPNISNDNLVAYLFVLHIELISS